MQVDLIKEIVSGFIGKPGESIIDILYKKKNVNEFLISKRLNLTINQTRNLLYRLADHGLVQFIRKKDSKKGGWYTYFWTLDSTKSLELLKEQINKKINDHQIQLEKRKNERFYYSPSSELEYTEEEALENNFICPETGDVLQLRDNKEGIEQIEIQISKLKIFLEEVNQELSEMEEKKKKDIQKKLKVEQKIKEEEKKARKKKLEREKKKANAANSKKKPKIKKTKVRKK